VNEQPNVLLHQVKGKSSENLFPYFFVFYLHLDCPLAKSSLLQTVIAIEDKFILHLDRVQHFLRQLWDSKNEVIKLSINF